MSFIRLVVFAFLAVCIDFSEGNTRATNEDDTLRDIKSYHKETLVDIESKIFNIDQAITQPVRKDEDRGKQNDPQQHNGRNHMTRRSKRMTPYSSYGPSSRQYASSAGPSASYSSSRSSYPSSQGPSSSHAGYSGYGSGRSGYYTPPHSAISPEPKSATLRRGSGLNSGYGYQSPAKARRYYPPPSSSGGVGGGGGGGGTYSGTSSYSPGPTGGDYYSTGAGYGDSSSAPGYSPVGTSSAVSGPSSSYYPPSSGGSSAEAGYYPPSTSSSGYYPPDTGSPSSYGPPSSPSMAGPSYSTAPYSHVGPMNQDEYDIDEKALAKYIERVLKKASSESDERSSRKSKSRSRSRRRSNYKSIENKQGSRPSSRSSEEDRRIRKSRSSGSHESHERKSRRRGRSRRGRALRGRSYDDSAEDGSYSVEELPDVDSSEEHGRRAHRDTFTDYMDDSEEASFKDYERDKPTKAPNLAMLPGKSQAFFSGLLGNIFKTAMANHEAESKGKRAKGAKSLSVHYPPPTPPPKPTMADLKDNLERLNVMLESMSTSLSNIGQMSVYEGTQPTEGFVSAETGAYE